MKKYASTSRIARPEVFRAPKHYDLDSMAKAVAPRGRLRRYVPRTPCWSLTIGDDMRRAFLGAVPLQPQAIEQLIHDYKAALALQQAEILALKPTASHALVFNRRVDPGGPAYWNAAYVAITSLPVQPVKGSA